MGKPALFFPKNSISHTDFLTCKNKDSVTDAPFIFEVLPFS